jgi:hypothetical protein
MRSFAVTLACVLAVTVRASLIGQQVGPRRCSEAKTPKRLPPPSALLDSSGAVAALAAFEMPPGGILVSILFKDRDSVPIMLPREVVNDSAVAVLTRFLRPQKPADVWGVRVRVVGGAAPALTLERSTYCPPVPTAESRVPLRVSVQVQPGDQLPTSNRGRIQLVAEVTVSETGGVELVRVIRSSGLRDLDDEYARIWQMRRFLPALLDGMPIPSSYRTDAPAR